MIRSIAAILTLAGILSTSDANAQHIFRRGPSPGTVAATSSSSPSVGPRVHSYSYYTRSPFPARTYVGYGDNDFPFHGVPYGHPYDPWSFSTLSGTYGQGLARYYDPPVK